MDNQIELALDEELQRLNSQQNLSVQDLYDIQFKTPPSNVRLPNANSNNTYRIDLNSRMIQAPEFLSVEKDHKSTVIYFKTNRYHNAVDLANTVCVVEYIIPSSTKRVPYIYVVPFFDTMTYMAEGTMVFPWVISGIAAQTEGIIEYDVRFFRLASDSTDDNQTIAYDLHTLSASSKVLTGLSVDETEAALEYDFEAGYKETLAAQIIENKTYWHTLE